MIDIRLLRADPELFIAAAKAKRMNVDIHALLEIDAKLTKTRQEIQVLRTAQNAAGKDIAGLQGPDKQEAIAKMAQIKGRMKELGEWVDDLEPKFDELMLMVAQPADSEVPVGKDDTENVLIRTEGKLPAFDFEPKDHVQLGIDLDILDIDRGVKLAGSRNYVLKGAGAMLHQAILRLAVDQMIDKGYTLMSVPVLVNESVMYGTGYFPLGRDQAYLVERDGMSLVGTAEVPVTAYHSGEILEESQLPKKYVALSTCFRREAGAAGKDTTGLYRVHLFDKVEQVVLGPNDQETSKALHQEILHNAEDMLQALHLPYRVMNVCTGDLGQGQIQKFDIETWMPSRNAYGETHSASRFYEFQARRLNIRYRDKNGEVKFCHTLNNTRAGTLSECRRQRDRSQSPQALHGRHGKNYQN
jgi:seryl-tRNA synthetase